ncbi:MAG: NADH-quinone oxidoreductase subunit L [Planctomycetes bacterium]|nr:NADH-quinone oxidoreductase subunit L [Planctomycetota bacterium]
MANHTYEIMLALGILSPMLSFWLLVFFGARLGKPASGWLAVVLGMGVPLALSTYVLVGWLGADAATRASLTAGAFRYHWADIGSVPVNVGVKLDSLTVIMYFMVTFIAFWIFVFSVGYMAGHSDEVDHQSKYHRFFAYLSLFGFSMLGLVVSSSLLFLFIFWELVGLCSYLLIGYYFDRAYASAAAIKAFVTNRVGDFGFLIGLMLVFFQLNTLDLDQAAAVFAEQYAQGTGIFASSFTLFGWSLATIMGIGLFCGAMGKSAQFPLHVWLPDAMAGPTPVSALIHAATMVAAGVYLVARVFRLMTPDALMFVATIGCLTLFLMALVAIVQTDIKKCLAYSTLSQLGYMIFGMGCGAWIAALFHLMTHAFFKAMLFLGSGQVIEGCHHEQDMRKMGGLIKKMPVTGVTFLIGVLAIAGFGVAGTHLGLGGFFSKDEILAVAYARAFEWDDPHKHETHGEHAQAAKPEPPALAGGFTGGVASGVQWLRPLRVGSDSAGTVQLASEREHGAATETQGPRGLKPAARTGGDHAAHHGESVFHRIPPLPKWMFWLAIVTAYVTPFYMMRCWWMTFMGKPRDEHVYHHAHESPLMYVPLAVLAVGTFVSSYFLFRPLIADAAPAATAAPLVMALDGESHTAAISAAHHWLVTGVGGAFIVGFVVAIVIYVRGLATATAIKRAAGPLHTLLERKYYFDEVYNLVWVKGCILVAHIARFIDTYVVDLIFDTAAMFTERFAAFSGLILDNQGVDGVVNGVAAASFDLSNVIRRPQTGRIRNYVLFAAGVAAVVLLGVLWWSSPESAPAMILPTG